MRAPPVRSYIHIARAERPGELRADQHAVLAVNIGMRNGRTRTRCGALRGSRWRSCERLVDQPDLAAAAGSAGRRGRASSDFDDVPEAKSSRSTSAVRRPREAASRAHAGAGDAAADDEHVEGVLGQPAERIAAVEPAGADHRPASVEGASLRSLVRALQGSP